MHFFHPIQQSAQQVYHTAVPLSPTSSQLRKSCLQDITNNQLAHITAFLGAPHTWGSLLRVIDTGPGQPTCIATSGQRIISACEDTLNIYNAITGVLQQSICVPETVVKIQASTDGSILFLAHPSSVTMWDVQTGGLIHTFTTQSKINDIAVSTTHIACGLADGSVRFWDIHTREQGKGNGSGYGQPPVVTIHWLSPLFLVVATQGIIYTHEIISDQSLAWFSTPKNIWGMVYLEKKLLIGISWQAPGVRQKQFSFVPVNVDHTSTVTKLEDLDEPDPAGIEERLQLSLDDNVAQLQAFGTYKPFEYPQSAYSGQLESPTLVGNDITCITPATGVQIFSTSSHCWTGNPALLGAARSLAMSLGRNIVAQTNNSIQIFSVDVLTDVEAHNVVHSSHVYPLGEKYIACIQSDRHLALLELDTMEVLHPNNNTPLQPPLGNLSSDDHVSPLMDKSPFACVSFSHQLVARLGILSAMQAWQSGTPLPEWTEAVDEGVQLSGLSPKCTQVITVYSSPQQELCIEDVKCRTTLANLPLQYEYSIGKVYDLGFDSETRFYLKIDGPGQHVKVPYKIIPSPSEHYSHTVTRGELVHLSGPQETPPYMLDANCEWVIDRESRKICWIPPGNLQRGDGGHFWAGLSLIMVGDDGIVRKLSFRKPDS